MYWISFFRNLLGFYGFFLLMFNFFLFNTCTETISYSCMSCYFNNEEFIYYSSLKVLLYCFINWCYVFKKKNYWNLRINYITKDTLMTMLLTYMKSSYVPVYISQLWQNDIVVDTIHNVSVIYMLRANEINCFIRT